MNYYPHHIGDYAKDTAHLTLLEDGAYRRLLDLCYASERPLPLDREKLYRLVRARTTADKAAVSVVLGEFFVEGEDGWHQRRVEEELARAHEKSSKASASAAKRWHSGGNANSSNKAMRTHSERNAPNSQEPRANNQEPEKKSNGEGRAAALPGWLPVDAWHGWLEVRKKNRAPNTPRALELAVGVLAKLKDAGNDPREVLEKSTLRGWRGLFPLDDSRRPKEIDFEALAKKLDGGASAAH